MYTLEMEERMLYSGGEMMKVRKIERCFRKKFFSQDELDSLQLHDRK